MTRIGHRLSDRDLQRLSWASLAFYVLSFASSGVVQALDPRLGGNSTGPGDYAFVAMTALFPAVGVLIVRQQPRNTVGWLLHLTGVAWGLAGWSDAYSRLALHVVPSLPGGYLAEVLGSVTWWPAVLAMSVYTVLFFPNGRLPSPRWRLVPWVAGVDCLLGVLLFTFSPGKITDVIEPLDHNPYALPIPHTLFVVLVAVLFPLLPLSLLASAASLLVRFRGSAGVQRLQLKWLLYAMATVAGTYAVSTSVSVTGWADVRIPGWVNAIQTVSILSFGLIPVAIGIAVTRHGLYGIDRLISRTLLVGLLGVFVTSVYIGIVVGLGAIVGQRQPSVWLSVVATAIVAVVFQPAREAVRRGVNRIVYGARATPYEVLSDFASRMAGRYTTAELLPRIARTLSECLGGAEVAMWLRDGRQLTREARWPGQEGGPRPQPVPVVDADDLPPLPADRTVPVRHRGELLGAISVTRSAAEPLSPAEQRLVEHVASQTGLVLRNVRLVDDLQASRARLVSSSDEERRRLERNLHDGAQQSLVAVALMLRMAAGGRDATALKAALAQSADQLHGAIGELRELARGIHPAILTDRGLGPAVQSLAERSPLPVHVQNTVERRLPTQVESTLYYVVAESLTNVAKYARAQQVSIALQDLGSTIALEVVDDGVGGAATESGSGLIGLSDRVSVVHGTFSLHSPVGGGTRVGCVVPAPPRGAAPDTDAPVSRPELLTEPAR